jgi:hypothetical protein
MTRVLVRYKVKPEHAAENERLVRAVYDELQRTEPKGFHYATLQLDDGVTFVHLASTESGDGQTPLAKLEAFRRSRRTSATAATSRRSSPGCVRSGPTTSSTARASLEQTCARRCRRRAQVTP